MQELSIVSCALLAYLLGSVPTAVWYGLAYFGIDIRQHGSGNAGATNTFRVLGKRAGTAVMLIDILKGWTATSLALILYYLQVIDLQGVIACKILFGTMAVVGHIFPVFAHFKGGKGVATLLGMVLSLHPEAALLCIAVFLLVMITFRYVSLASMIAALAFPLSMIFRLFGTESSLTIIFGFVFFLIIVITHQKNIIRLIRGQESRTYLFKRKK
ncbi:MAG: glycerol-3-phosphate 1-O-acyltransferase PlsY [Spirosomataceae bacterium]